MFLINPTYSQIEILNIKLYNLLIYLMISAMSKQVNIHKALMHPLCYILCYSNPVKMGYYLFDLGLVIDF